MAAFIKQIAGRIARNGFADTVKYAWFRMSDSFHLWRLGIKKPLMETMENLTRNEIGLVNSNCHEHNPTPSYKVFRSLMDRFIKPQQNDVLLDYGSGLGCAVLMAAT